MYGPGARPDEAVGIEALRVGPQVGTMMRQVDRGRHVDVRRHAYDCFTLKKGKGVSKLESCKLSFTGATLTIKDGGGVDDHLTWIVTASDATGNAQHRVADRAVPARRRERGRLADMSRVSCGGPHEHEASTRDLKVRIPASPRRLASPPTSRYR